MFRCRWRRQLQSEEKSNFLSAASSTLSHSSCSKTTLLARLNGSSSKKYHRKARSFSRQHTHTQTRTELSRVQPSEINYTCKAVFVESSAGPRNICCGQFRYFKTHTRRARAERAAKVRDRARKIKLTLIFHREPDFAFLSTWCEQFAEITFEQIQGEDARNWLQLLSWLFSLSS